VVVRNDSGEPLNVRLLDERGFSYALDPDGIHKVLVDSGEERPVRAAEMITTRRHSMAVEGFSMDGERVFCMIVPESQPPTVSLVSGELNCSSIPSFGTGRSQLAPGETRPALVTPTPEGR
jgi:hypothetical protein